MTVAVLFARADSHYKALPGVDVYDMERDARTYDGPRYWMHCPTDPDAT